MRYIGNKENIVDQIYQVLVKNGVQGTSFFDFFSGTASVARYFKKKGYKIFSSDVMYFSYCLQKAYIENNEEPLFERLPRVCSSVLNGTTPKVFNSASYL